MVVFFLTGLGEQLWLNSIRTHKILHVTDVFRRPRDGIQLLPIKCFFGYLKGGIDKNLKKTNIKKKKKTAPEILERWRKKMIEYEMFVMFIFEEVG